MRPWDVILLAAGTHKLSRTISKDSVTAPLRAPFTRYVDRGGPAEVMEEVRATGGLRHSVGELLTCPGLSRRREPFGGGRPAASGRSRPPSREHSGRLRDTVTR